VSAIDDPLRLDLDGIRVVEASAGTGKTFTIATLYLRLILERGLQVEEIVVATFTRAAAAELSERLRERLVIAGGVLAGDDPAAPRDGDDGETRETRRIIAQALQGATPDALRERARQARLAIDTAFIGTLHGFCHRALAEFGFDTGQALRTPELIEDIRALQLEIVRDFWRRGSADAATAQLLADTWKTPDALARQACDPRWRERAIELPEVDVAAAATAFEDAARRVATCPVNALDGAERELQRCIKDTRARNSRVAALRQLHAWSQAGATPDAANFDPKAAASLGVENITCLKPEGVGPEGQVFNDVAALARAFESLKAARAVAATLPAATLLHAAYRFVESELPKRLAERQRMGHDQAVDRLAGALADPARGERTAGRIRARWKAALIDEFQDTDAQQWRVVKKLFGAATLVLVGDPKQAIYGFRGGDVFTWLQACDEARRQARGGEASLRLRDSYRAGAGMCRAINALFSRTDAFVEADIEHPDLQSARSARALLHHGEPVPALQLWWLDPDRIEHAADRLPSKEHARRAIQDACVAWIARALADAAFDLRDEHGARTRLLPRHVAVLVNDNRQALAMQAALGRAGVPACSNLRASVYASDEAADLALLLDAVAVPGDPRRARAAHASVLIGADAADIVDEARQALMLERVAGWADAVRRHGPLPWLRGLLEAAAPRLLALPDGQRRVANHLQLAELLQALHAQSFGLDDLATRFARARIEAVDDEDSARLRLDSDADAVTVSTVHAAKGLEYDVVLVPYAVLGQDPDRKRNGQPALHWYHDGTAARVAIGDGASDTVRERAIREIVAEEVRKLYVAVTRARVLCVLPCGPTSATPFSPLHYLLHVAGRAAPLPADATGCGEALRDLCEHADGDAERIDLPDAAQSERASPRQSAPALRAHGFTRATLERDWQVWSFSRLVRGSSHPSVDDPLPGTGDGDAPPAEAATDASNLGGARFGTAVHAMFERTEFAAWRDAVEAPDRERALIERSLRDQGLGETRAAMARAVAAAGTCVRDALNAALPCGARLCDVAPEQRRAEIEFHLSLHRARGSELYALLHRHGYPRQRGGAPPSLHGLLTGKIDLTFRHAGRFHIVDWKTNRCAPYDDAAVRAEIAMHDYDLQWLIYTLALHRWLRQRLPGYDYDRHVGDVYYLFVRGMQEGRGVHVDRPPRSLVEAMDALFDPHAGSGA
jgi:exodeoxyribonuclease V beta subunit